MLRKSSRQLLSKNKLNFNHEKVNNIKLTCIVPKINSSSSTTHSTITNAAINEDNAYCFLNAITTATRPTATAEANRVHINAIRSRVNNATKRLERQTEKRKYKQFLREIQGRKVTELDLFTPLAIKKFKLFQTWKDNNMVDIMKLFKDFIGFDENVQSDFEFDASVNYWDISAYRCYHIEKCLPYPDNRNKFATNAMSLRLGQTQQEIQLTVSPEYRFMFEDELNLEILNKQGQLWQRNNEEEKKKLSFYDYNRL